jgi:quercetin dioxygenase-like cupin family protein
MKRKHSEKKIQELASSYALGALGKRELEEFERLLEEGYQLCEAELRGFREVVSQIGYSTTPVSPSANLKERLLSRVKGEARAIHKAGFLFVRSTEGEWKEIAKGVSLKRLFFDPGRQYATALVRMSAGTSFPRHRHTETEECYVLEGDIRMGDQVFRAGDYVRAEAGSIHEGIYSESGCMLLILSSQRNEILE